MKKKFSRYVFIFMIYAVFSPAIAFSQDVKTYQGDIESIFKKAKERIAELQVKIEEEKHLARVEQKAKEIAELDAEAESFMSKGDFKKAKAIYEKILKVSAEDPDLKDYITRANIEARREEAERQRQ